MKKLADLIKEEVEDRFDHKNLNLDTPEFASLIPSTENLAIVIHNILRNKISGEYGLTVRLWETPRNYVEYPA